MKVREILHILRADGWYIVKSGGSSHRQLKHPTKRGRVTVAGREGENIPPGTLKSIQRQAQLEE
jgi:predicted RNA binding protein YcfA (HicA-like mRNA interferase family)